MLILMLMLMLMLISFCLKNLSSSQSAKRDMEIPGLIFSIHKLYFSNCDK